MYFHIIFMAFLFSHSSMKLFSFCFVPFSCIHFIGFECRAEICRYLSKSMTLFCSSFRPSFWHFTLDLLCNVGMGILLKKKKVAGVCHFLVECIKTNVGKLSFGWFFFSFSVVSHRRRICFYRGLVSLLAKVKAFYLHIFYIYFAWW